MTMDMGAPSQTCWFSGGVPRPFHHLIPPQKKKRKKSHTLTYTHFHQFRFTNAATKTELRSPLKSNRRASERESERIRSHARWDGQASDHDDGMCPLKETKGREKWRDVEWVVSTAHAFLFCQMLWDLFFTLSFLHTWSPFTANKVTGPSLLHTLF
jgi:hypothetical protein